MINPLSMFMEKDPLGSGTNAWSMTRIVAFLSSVTLNYALATMARTDNAHDLGWPFCALGVVTLLAIPLQTMFKLLNQWIQSRAGQRLLGHLIEKVPVLLDKVVGPTVQVEGPSTVNVSPETATMTKVVGAQDK